MTLDEALLLSLFCVPAYLAYLNRKERRQMERLQRRWERMTSPDAPSPPRPPAAPAWATALGVTLPVTAAQVRGAYRLRAKECHPDAGGAHDQMQQLNLAHEQAQRWLVAARLRR